MKNLVICILIAASAIATNGCVTATRNNQLVIKEVNTRNNMAHVQFMPGPIKYEAELNGKKITLVPRKFISAWYEGSFESQGGLLHSFRSENGDYDELTLIAKEENFDKQFEVTLTCFFPDGETTVKKVRVMKGASRIISMNDKEVVVALQPE